MLVFRNRDCLSLFFCSNTTLVELRTLVLLFFPKSAFPNWGCGFSQDAVRSQKTVRYSEQIMSTDKYPCTFSHQMEVLVYILVFIRND